MIGEKTAKVNRCAFEIVSGGINPFQGPPGALNDACIASDPAGHNFEGTTFDLKFENH
jgi:hypothetical protein